MGMGQANLSTFVTCSNSSPRPADFRGITCRRPNRRLWANRANLSHTNAHGTGLEPCTKSNKTPSTRQRRRRAHGKRVRYLSELDAPVSAAGEGGVSTLRTTPKAASTAQERPTLAACFEVGIRAA
jgi:hypothetical protein